MTVSEKMTYVLNTVLKDKNESYLVEIINDGHYKVFEMGIEILDTKTTTDVMSHWRSCINNTIAFIINDRIKSALNEV